ncbi:MAG: DUF4214 domain-containing protein [Lysobacter sp.]|nr:DUF4214 domain-containing protein [Lysobacter sp.]
MAKRTLLVVFLVVLACALALREGGFVVFDPAGAGAGIRAGESPDGGNPPSARGAALPSLTTFTAGPGELPAAGVPVQPTGGPDRTHRRPSGAIAGSNRPAASPVGSGTPAAPRDVASLDVRRAEARRLLTALYRDLKGREGDPDAIAMWADLIAAGTMTREQAVEHFLDSARSLQTSVPLARLYFASFQRVPDEAGWSHWRDVAASGQSLQTISDAFAASDEFAAIYGGLGDPQFLDLAYRNTLGRSPNPAELAQWQSQLASGGATRGRVLLALSESPEFREAVTNEVNASLLYSGLLGRTADAPGFAAWMRTIEQQRLTRSALISGFLDSPEYRARTATAGSPGR